MPYGKTIPNLKINGQPAPYPVVNEREIRAAAGLMFLIGSITFAYVFFTRDFAPIYILVPIFWLDFLLKSVLQPHYSIFGWLGSLLVKKQDPEYVGAIQKRFAWSIGLALASIMMVFVLGMEVRGLLPFSICSVCLFFMWMESSLGICVGCKIYSALINKGLLKSPDIKPACPGGSCSIIKRK
jgi:hypothetical protein